MATSVVAVLLVGDAIYVATGLLSSLALAGARLESAAGALRQADPVAARTALAEAHGSAERARRLTYHPAFLLARFVPGARGEARAVADIARALELASGAGGEVTAALTRLAPAGDPLNALYRDGHFELDALDALSEPVASAADALERARVLTARDGGVGYGPLLAALHEANDRLTDLARGARRASAALQVLPAMLGKGGERTYLLAFLSPSEARGSGGLFGLFGILKARSGQLTLGPVAPTSVFPGRGEVAAPAWYRRAYARFGALSDPRQMTFSPSFPLVGATMVQRFENATGRALDGVLAMDPLALAQLLRATGPIRAAGLERMVGPDEAPALLMRDIYSLFDSEQDQNAYLGALVEAVWHRLTRRSLRGAKLLEPLGSALFGGHFKVALSAPSEAALAGRAGIDGDPARHGPLVQMVFHNNATATKVDYFLERRVDTEVSFLLRGGARVTTTVTLSNGAPQTGPQLLVGPLVEGDEAGLSAGSLHVLLPRGAELVAAEAGGRPDFPGVQLEGVHPVAIQGYELAAGASGTFSFTYRLPARLLGRSGHHALFTLFPHAAVRPDRFTLSFIAPGGAVVRELSGERRARQVLTYEGVLDRPFTADVRLAVTAQRD